MVSIRDRPSERGKFLPLAPFMRFPFPVSRFEYTTLTGNGKPQGDSKPAERSMLSD
jgi:hypothetical protein